MSPVNFVNINILGPLSKIECRNKYSVAITYCYSKLAKGIQIVETAAIRITIFFTEHWMANLGIPCKIPTDNRP